MRRFKLYFSPEVKPKSFAVSNSGIKNIPAINENERRNEVIFRYEVSDFTILITPAIKAVTVITVTASQDRKYPEYKPDNNKIEHEKSNLFIRPSF